MNKLKKRILYAFYVNIKKDRIAYARKLGVRIGSNCNICTNPSKVFGSEPWLIKLGNHVEITDGVKFITHKGELWCARMLEEYKQKDYFAPIVIGNNVFIGMNTIIMPGVSIGNNVIIGSNSVVTKDIPCGTVYAGTPAKQVSSMDDFLAKIKNMELVETKNLKQEEKREYLKKIHPEWFDL